MRLAIERRQPVIPEPHLLELIPSRADGGVLGSAEGVLAAISGREPFALEMGATNRGPWFLVRTESESRMRQLHAHLGSRYHHAVSRRLDGRPYPAPDHGRLQPTERAIGCTFKLRAPAYLPLRTFEDQDLKLNPQTDPAVSLLSGLGSLPDEWRAISQLVLRRAPDNWGDKYQRFAVEPAFSESGVVGSRVSLTPVVVCACAIASVGAYLCAHHLYEAGAWLQLALLVAGGTSLPMGGVWLARKLAAPDICDRRLVQEKLRGIGYEAQLRLAVVGPEAADPEELVSRLNAVASSYGQFTLGTGNALVQQSICSEGFEPRSLEPWGNSGWPLTLNTRELAGLWHLPLGSTDVALLERTAVRHFLPLPDAVSNGCRIGVSRAQDREMTVCLPDYLFRRHVLMVAKTGSGKSSLMELFVDHLARPTGPGESRPAVVLIDPHEDLVREVLGRIPASRRADVVYLDASNITRPFGLNLLDYGFGWTRDTAIDIAITIFQHEYSAFWGPRMENAFRHGMYTLFEANRIICTNDPRGGRRRQYTILDTPAVLVNHAFRRALLRDIPDPHIHDWWASFYDPLDRKLQLETINPVQTKIYRFAGSLPARMIVGQPCSTVDPQAWLHAGSIVVVNTAAGALGPDTAGMLGSALLNLLKLGVAAQSAMERSERQRLTMIVDEMHTMPAVDYEGIVAELSKFGANLIVSTQSLAQLDALDLRFQRALKATLFSNIKGLFVFGVSGEDAKYLAPEMGGSLDDQDLIGLGDHQCYVRMSDATGTPLPPFWVELDRPPHSNPTVRQSLATASAALYGRDAKDVDDDLRFGLVRVQDMGRIAHVSEPGSPDIGTPLDSDVTAASDGNSDGQKRKRNEHRNRASSSPDQRNFFSQLGDGPRPNSATSDGAADEQALPTAEHEQEDRP